MGSRELLGFNVNIIQYLKVVGDEPYGNDENVDAIAAEAHFLQDFQNIWAKPFLAGLASALISEGPMVEFQEVSYSLA